MNFNNMPVGKVNGNSWFNTIRKKDLNPISNTQGIAFELNKHNSKIIKNLISKSDDYNPKMSLDIIVFESFGGNKSFKNNARNKSIVQLLVRCIDLVNSTNAWRMKGKQRQGLENIVDYICDTDKDFWNRCKDGDTTLVDDLAKASVSYNGKSGNKLISLSSKVCRFFNINLFGKDDYYIWDKVILHVIRFYWNAYGIKGWSRKPDSYQELWEKLEKIKKHSQDLKRFEMDCIMWYSYRNGN